MKNKTMDFILILIGIAVLIFTIAMIQLYILTGGIPEKLCTCFFVACTGECGFMGWIKTSKTRAKEQEQQQKYEELSKELDILKQQNGVNTQKKYIMTKEQAINKILTAAQNELGYKEKRSNSQLDDKTANAGSGNYTKYARDLDKVTSFYNGAKNGYAWCDVFVDWLFYHCFGASAAMKMLCQPTKSAGAGCSYSADYYKSQNQWSKNPAPGYQIFFTYGGSISHTGIVEQVNGWQIVTIEGNTSDQVARRTYSITDSRIYGYGVPRWEYATNKPEDSIPDQQSEQTVITTILKKGSYGSEVTNLQKNLISLGYSCGKYGADGDFGDDTAAAVKKFQKDNNLTVDGEAGPQTQTVILQKINKNKTPVPVYEKTYIVQAGDNLWDIAVKKLGHGNRYKEIKTLNNLKSNLLIVGQELKLPEK